MRIPPRILVPVIAAVLTVGVIIGFLFWQLEGTRALLQKTLDLPGITDNLGLLQPDATVDPETADEALLHLRRGDMQSLRGEWAGAVTEYQLAVDAGGGLPALRKLAQAQLQRRDIRGAQDTLDKLRRAGARSEDILLLESIISLRAGEIARAQQLLSTADDSPQKHYGLGLLAIITGDHQNAQTELGLVVGGWEPVLRSYARIILGAYEEYALFADSPVIHLQTLLGRALAQVQECELALPLLSQVTNSQDDYRDAWIVQGFCELSTERFAEALASLERAYQLDPEKPETQYFLARSYMSLDDHANALTFLQYALRNGFEPEEEVRRLIAREALEMDNAALAFEQYELLAQRQDADIQTYADYVAAAIATERADEALVKAQEATTKWPQSAMAFDLLGWASAESGRPEEARAALTKALDLDPNLASAKERLKNL